MRAVRSGSSVPIPRADGLLVQEVGDELVVFDTDSKEAHCLKPLAAFVFRTCDGTRSVDDVASAAQDQLGLDVTPQQVSDAVMQLEAINLLAAPPVVVLNGDGDSSGVSRREMMRRVGFAGAVVAFASPLITSVTPASAGVTVQSGIITGCSGCGQNSDCVSNHCCQTVPGKQCAQSCCVGQDNSCHYSGCVSAGQPFNGGTCSCTGNSCQCCNCTVCLSELGGSPCPTAGQCPGGNAPCCTTTC